MRYHQVGLVATIGRFCRHQEVVKATAHQFILQARDVHVPNLGGGVGLYYVYTSVHVTLLPHVRYCELKWGVDISN